MDARACFAFVLSLVLVEKGFAIHCFICNSWLHGSDCNDIMALNETTRKLYSYNCDRLEGNKKYTKCRKITNDFTNKRDLFSSSALDKRVIRQCAITGKDGCLKRSGTKAVQFTYCQCKKSLCNSSAKHPPLPSIAIFSVLLYHFILTVKHCLLSF